MGTRHTRLCEDITSRIRDLVAQTDLRPGDRLPPERHLAKIFQVSRNSVREAIKSLEQQGILISKAGSGTFVADQSASSLSQALEQVFIRQRHRLADIFELRLILEPQIAFLAAQRITDQECDHLDEMLRQQEQAIADNTAYQEHDLAFHDFIAACTGNEAIGQLMEKVQDMLTESRDEALRSPRRDQESFAGHRQIGHALRGRDPELAREAMVRHLQHTRHRLFTNTGGTDE